MSIASEITRLQTAKANLKTQIEAKGVTVDSAATLDSYASYVEEIPTGGGDENRLNSYIKGDITAITEEDLSGVTTLRNALFQDAHIKSFYLNNVTRFGGSCFNGSLITGATFNDSIAYLGSSCFRNCTGLTSLSFDTVNQVDNYCFASSFLNSIYINNVTQTLGQYTFDGCTRLTAATINHINSLSDYVFRNCSSLQSFTTDAAAMIGGNTFNGCTSLTSVTFTNPKFARIGQTSTHYRNFQGCSSLQYIDFTSAAIIPTMSSSNNFSGVSANMEIRVPQSLYDSWTAATNWNATGVKEHIVAYPDAYNTVTFHLTTNDGNDCDSTTAYSASAQWTGTLMSREFDAATGGTVVMYGPLTIPDGAYSGKTNLVTFEMSPGVASAGDIVFYNCDNLSSVTLSNTMTTAGRLFMNCYSLTSVVFPDSMTEIVGGMCDNCTALTSVVIGSGVTEIGRETALTDSIIRDCDNLSSITFRSVVPPTVLRGSIISGGTPATGTLYVPAASVSAYEAWIVGTGLANWTVTAISE